MYANLIKTIDFNRWNRTRCWVVISSSVSVTYVLTRRRRIYTRTFVTNLFFISDYGLIKNKKKNLINTNAQISFYPGQRGENIRSKNSYILFGELSIQIEVVVRICNNGYLFCIPSWYQFSILYAFRYRN